ncbi:hypothetical protein [Burkholderia gladioli]|uniref:hypothetical protein n=1 Tax=Burkholderia gladioli TaxID=28095 RepID=UPI0011B2203D|nr:hypothetical protein [Burkholderia gladioli]
MNILNFTKNSFAAALTFLSFIPFSHSEQFHERTNFKNSDVQISTDCSDRNGGTNCTVSAVTGTQKKELLSFPLAPSDIKLELKVFVIIFPCGPECSATYFYNPKKGSGGPFPRIISYNLHNELAASSSRNLLSIYRIYSKQGSKPAFTIRLDTNKKQDLADAVKKVKFEEYKITVTYINQKGDVKTVSRNLGN